MKDELRRPPVNVFHLPALHGGISYVDGAPDWIVRPFQGARVRMFAESDSDKLRARQQSAIARQMQIMPADVLEIQACPVVLDRASFASGLAQIDGRFWLNGAAGSRIRNRYERVNPEEWRQDRYLRVFQRTRRQGKTSLPAFSGQDADRLEVAIELKNGFNYYHFSAETLGSLAHFVDDDTNKRINLHLPKGEIKPFAEQFIKAIFPSIADRVQFVSKPRRYDQARSVYNHRHYLYCVEDKRVFDILESRNIDPSWSNIAKDASKTKIVGMQSYDTSLRLLRDNALARAKATNTAPYPKLVWMGRDESGRSARSRGITGHEQLLEELRARGFETVAFEHLPPLEQVATMHGADIVIAPHGAGLANMMYAKAGATVIEIGTRQTQMHRWGDFLKCAHVAECRYDTVFADVTGLDDIESIPPVSEGLLGVHVGKRATARILSIVDEILERPSAVRRRRSRPPS